MFDPNFSRTVIFWWSTTTTALGIVLNRPSDTKPDHLREEWGSFVTPVVFVCGPVQWEATIARPLRAPTLRRGNPLLGRVGSIDLADGLREAHPHLETLRVFSGTWLGSRPAR
jgi:hypothetical protein